MELTRQHLKLLREVAAGRVWQDDSGVIWQSRSTHVNSGWSRLKVTRDMHALLNDDRDLLILGEDRVFGLTTAGYRVVDAATVAGLSTIIGQVA